MRRAFQFTFVWFFAVSSGVVWAGVSGMADGQTVSQDVIVVASAD